MKNVTPNTPKRSPAGKYVPPPNPQDPFPSFPEDWGGQCGSLCAVPPVGEILRFSIYDVVYTDITKWEDTET